MQVVVVEVVVVVQVEGIIGMVGLDDGRRVVGLDNGRVHHRLDHRRQHHRLDDVVRHTVHYRRALVGNGGRQMDDFGHMQWLDMVVVRVQGVLRIVVVVAVQETRTGRRQGAQGEQSQYLKERHLLWTMLSLDSWGFAYQLHHRVSGWVVVRFSPCTGSRWLTACN